MSRRATIFTFPADPPSGPRFVSGWLLSPAILCALFFAALVLLHSWLLRLPYFWDEAGYYIPAARDLLLTGSLIPHSTLSNAHPPLVMAWLALVWKVFGYSPLAARSAMLLVAAFTLSGVFHLSRRIANDEVAWGSVVCTAFYPVFFSQSSMAHLDMAAAGFTIWALDFYLRDRRWQMAILFGLACLSKETAILAPAALFVYETICSYASFRRGSRHPLCHFGPNMARMAWLLCAAAPLVLWFTYHHHQTGYLFGNPEFLRYNVAATLHPVRILAAFAERLWHAFGYMNMFILTLTTLLAMTRPALAFEEPAVSSGNGSPRLQRERIAIPIQLIFGAVSLTYLLALSVVGGAVLARYLLPIYPLIIIVCVSTIWRRLPWWPAFLGITALGFVVGLIVNPPYHFAPEDNLTYADYVRVHQHAARYAEEHYSSGRILTAWPASDELTHPYLGYVTRVIPVVRIEDFSAEQILAARQAAVSYDAILAFSTKYEPTSGFLIHLDLWEKLQERYFDYHRDVLPGTIAEMLGGDIKLYEAKRGEWVAVIDSQRPQNVYLREISAFPTTSK